MIDSSLSSMTVRSFLPRVVASSVLASLIVCTITARADAQANAQDGAQLLRVRPAVGPEFVWAAVMKTRR
jgi:hypothetical protein